MTTWWTLLLIKVNMLLLICIKLFLTNKIRATKLDVENIANNDFYNKTVTFLLPSAAGSWTDSEGSTDSSGEEESSSNENDNAKDHTSTQQSLAKNITNNQSAIAKSKPIRQTRIPKKRVGRRLSPILEESIPTRQLTHWNKSFRAGM